jgi:hypothetical protein
MPFNSGTTPHGADLYNTDLRGVLGVTEVEIRKMAEFDANTKFGDSIGEASQ